MTSETSSPAAAEPRQRSYAQKLWVPIVLLVGLALGELIAVAAAAYQPYGYIIGQGQNGFLYFHPFPVDPDFGAHIVLSTVEIALLIALVVVYAKVFAETKANFALGLVVVLFALLVQAMLSNPLIDDLFYTPSIGPGIFSPVTDIIAICAYTIFLYLSLE